MGKDLCLAIRLGDHHGELIVDPESPYEVLFSLPLYAGVTAVLGCSLYLVLSFFKVVHDFDAYVWDWMGKGIVLIVLGAFLRSMVGLHYTLDSELRSVNLWWRLGPWTFRHRICSFDNVDHLLIDSVSSRVKETYSSNYYTDKHRYGLLLVRRRGLSVRLLERDYEDFGELQSAAQRVAETLDVELRGNPGQPNSGTNSMSCTGCLQGCGAMIAFVFVMSICGVGSSSGKGSGKTELATKPAPILSGIPVSYAALLKKSGHLREAQFLEYGLVKIHTNSLMWKAIGDPRMQPSLFEAFNHCDDVVIAMAKKLKLRPLAEKGHKDVSGLMHWSQLITLHVKLDFTPDSASLPLLVNNLKLGLRRMAIGSPRDGQARLTLVLSPEARKPQIQPETQGFTLVMPVHHPVKPSDLGLSSAKS